MDFLPLAALGARRNDRGPQKSGDPTFINALVNGEVAPIPDLPALAPQQGRSTLFGHYLRSKLCPKPGSDVVNTAANQITHRGRRACPDGEILLIDHRIGERDAL
jgi:hypothetical protein